MTYSDDVSVTYRACRDLEGTPVVEELFTRVRIVASCIDIEAAEDVAFALTLREKTRKGDNE